MKRTLLILLAVAISATTAIAQPRNGERNRNGKGQAQHQELRTQMRTWFETSVMPTLRTWHHEYDASLSASDLATLKQLRAEAKQLKNTTHQSMLALRDQGLSREERKEQGKALRERTHDEMMKIMEQVKPIAQRSKEKLREIFDRNEEQIDTWREQARKMVDAYCDEHDLDEGFGRRGGNGMMGGMGLLDGGRRAALRFILWDGSDLPDEPMMMDRNMGSIDVAPNPSGSTATVRMNNLANGPATIEVFDMNGNRKATHPVQVNAGTIDTTIPTSDLAPGTYMVSVSTATGRKSTTIIVNR